MNSKDIYSCYCTKCKTKNEWVEYMIQMTNDNESAKQEQIEMDYYRKNKNGELDR